MESRRALVVAVVLSAAGAFNVEPTAAATATAVPLPPAESASAQLKPVPSFFENFERSLTVTVDAGTETCFSQEVTLGHKVSFSFVVLNSDASSGRQLDIGLKVLAKAQRPLWILFTRTEWAVEDHDVDAADDVYTFCFHNNHGMTISQSHDKIVAFRLEVKGLADNVAMQKRIVEFLVDDMRGNTELLDNAIARIRLNVFNSQRAQFHIRAKNSKDVKYMEALTGMLDTWSAAHILVMVFVSVGQVLLLRRFFSISSSRGKQ